MKSPAIIWSLFFLMLCSNSFAQEQFKFDTVFSNTLSAEYFENNPSINTIELTRYYDKSSFISVYTKLIWQATGFEVSSSRQNYSQYNADLLGDIYLLEKKYGHLELPEKEINIFSKTPCFEYYNYTLSGSIRKDSIHLQLKYNCNTDPDVKVFQKVEVGVNYVGGLKKLKQYLEEKKKNEDHSLKKIAEDSVLIFTCLLNKKDSSLKRIELIEGNYSAFSKIMMNALINSGTWLPSIQGGRPVNSYFKIFIRLQKDNSILVDY